MLTFLAFATQNTALRALTCSVPRFYFGALVQNRDSSKAAEAQRQIKRLDRTVAAVLTATRRDSDITQETLATRMGWSRDVIANIESGRRKTSVSELVVMSKAMGTDAETIFRRIIGW